MGKVNPYLAKASCSIGFDPISGSIEILNANGKKASAFQIMGYLFVAGAHFLRDFFIEAGDEELDAEVFAKILEGTQLEVDQDNDGVFYLVAGEKKISPLEMEVDLGLSCLKMADRPSQNVTVETKQGSAIYHIHNLNVYITADVVQQLNVNPQQVINMIKDQLRDEIEIQKRGKNSC